MNSKYETKKISLKYSKYLQKLKLLKKEEIKIEKENQTNKLKEFSLEIIYYECYETFHDSRCIIFFV